ncbi:MAG: hypothetical protein KKD44_13060 [Proteobacteria bacterium]|nr:hypothetical protein [Pseudomonadota bacterium]
MKTIIGGTVVFAVMVMMGWSSASACYFPKSLSMGLEEPDVMYYSGMGPAGGLAHINYWTIDAASLTDRESQKARRIQPNVLHSQLFQPTQIISGYEATGVLNRNKRRQWITLKLPDDWNGDLVVCGTPGLRNEYANEGLLVPWLLEQGYAVISGNKGLENSWVDMLSGNHPTQHWGLMMHDMARWARIRLLIATMRWTNRIYAMGLSNGGYQVRLALEIDAKFPKWKRLFDGGLDWSGTYSPDARIMDTNKDGIVDIPEYYTAKTLVGHMDVASRAMGWAYSPDTRTTPSEYAQVPRYPGAHAAMESAGFTSESDIFWGFYNINYDYTKNYGLPQWQGVGYENLVSYVYRAELLGHDMAQSAPYSCFYNPDQPDEPPPLYAWLENAENGGWTTESIRWALANANTAEFKVPMITIVGNADGLLALNAHSVAYKQAVSTFGNPEVYRQYLIENGPHIDAHADGLGDFDFDGISGNEGADDELTPLEAYAQRAFMYLTDWVERGTTPPDSQTIETDPQNDITDPAMLSW